MGGGISSGGKYEKSAKPPIRLIDFQTYKTLPSMPRNPEKQGICTNLSRIDKNNSLIVFISHCWLRGWSGAPGWDGKPHPDNVLHDKHHLCIEGIEKVRKNLAPGMKHCYIWLDYGCINQDHDPAGELKQLDAIIRASDLIFTPIFDPHGLGLISDGYQNIYKEYLSPAWQAEQVGYISRAWCRVEMFYAANIPVDRSYDRLKHFTGGLRHLASHGIRPHVLYGSKEKNNNLPPLVLPPVQNSFYDELDPVKGFLTNESDRLKIGELIEQLRPYMKKVKHGYVGDKNEQGEREGKGKLTFPSGDVYDGVFKANKFNGQGKMVYANGNIYEGEYENGLMHGTGKFTFASGHIYSGQWKNGKMHGKGVFISPNGDQYDGDYAENKKCGVGKFTYISGSVYEGQYADDKMDGKGKFTYANGDVYEGYWANDKKHGQGRLIHKSNGAVEEGEWVAGKKVPYCIK